MPTEKIVSLRPIQVYQVSTVLKTLITGKVAGPEGIWHLLVTISQVRYTICYFYIVRAQTVVFHRHHLCHLQPHYCLYANHIKN